MEPATPAAPAPQAAPIEAPKAAPAAAPQPSDGGTAAPGTLGETRTYSQEDLDRITAKVKKNERYRTRKEVEAFYQGRESAAPKPDAQPAKPAEPVDKPPTRENFESYEAFLDAKAEYTGKKAAHEYRTKAEAEQKERAVKEAQAERVKTFQAKVTEKYPDLNDRLDAIAHVEMPAGMGEAIAESDFGPDVLNHFAENPKDFERIAALSPSAAIREIGRLEARLEGAQKPSATAAAPVTEVKKPSAAPAPLKPVGGTATVGDGEPSHDNPDAWKKWRDKQVFLKRQGKAK